ncbi:MAG: ShlB/FhaC/HecB family hemolysin secretion/activation protein [Cyanobium sp.]
MPGPPAALAPLLLAQLLAPSPQPGPVRLPTRLPPPPVQNRPPALAPAPALANPGAPERATPAAPQPGGSAPPAERAAPTAAGPAAPMPRLEGLERYPSALLQQILAPCLAPDADSAAPVRSREASEQGGQRRGGGGSGGGDGSGGGGGPGAPDRARLERCAALLTSRLVADGYLNSRVFPLVEPAPNGTLLVVEGRIVEVRVESPDAALRQRLQQLVLPLQGQVLHLPSLERQLDLLERLPGVSGVRASLNRLGGDSTKAVLVLQIDPRSRAVQGELSLRNDGNAGSGQFRALGVVARSGWLKPADQLVLVGELNADADPELGYRLVSLSYRLPLGSRLAFSVAAASSWRQLVENPPPLHDLVFEQAQLLGRFELSLHEDLRQRLSAFAGLSLNRTRSLLAGEPFAAILGGAAEGELSSGFLQVGLAWEGWLGNAALSASLYGLQGIPAFSAEAAVQELAFYGIELGQARAVGGELTLAWPLAPRWLLQLRGAGQAALAPLPNPMGFSLGSDNGLRGLPGQVISGDSGLLGSAELSWSFWRRGVDALQLVPFVGAGWVQTALPNGVETGSVGAGGLLLRWLSGRHWQLELGWAGQWGDGLGSTVPNWLNDVGLYSKVSYRF